MEWLKMFYSTIYIVVVVVWTTILIEFGIWVLSTIGVQVDRCWGIKCTEILPVLIVNCFSPTLVKHMSLQFLDNNTKFTSANIFTHLQVRLLLSCTSQLWTFQSQVLQKVLLYQIYMHLTGSILWGVLVLYAVCCIMVIQRNQTTIESIKYANHKQLCLNPCIDNQIIIHYSLCDMLFDTQKTQMSLYKNSTNTQIAIW